MLRLTPRLVHAAQLTALTLVSLVAFGGAGSSGAAAGAPGLVAAYAFDAGSGSTLADSSGLANTGTISGATWANGRNGGALSFDGVNDSVRINDAASLDLSTAMTLEAWVRPTTADTTWRTIVTKETTGNLTYGLFSNSDAGKPAGISTIGNQNTQSITRGPAALPRNSWRHLATTYDGASLRLYVNGALVSTTPVSGAMVNTDGALKIGGNAIWPEWFAGRIDDLRVYNRALTAAELQTDMKTPVTAASAPADTLAPTTPTGLAASAQSQTSITLTWAASTDNTGVAGYHSYRNGVEIGDGTSTSYAFTGLTCGTTYTLAVDAYDAAGNISGRPSLMAATSPCAPAGDTQAPTAPTGLSAGAQTQTAITLSWAPSTDNTGVAGYRSFRNGTQVGTGTASSSTFSGLTCGTSYSLAVEAYDAAGNTSTRPGITASTTACSPPPAPAPAPAPGSGTANLWVDTTGGSCVRQSAPGAYTDAQACSWSAAYQAAQTGDVIFVKGGSYGDVTMGANKAGTSNVTYRTASGENVVVDDFENGHIAGAAGVGNIALVGPVTARTFRSDKASNVTVDNWRVDCGGCVNVQIFHLESASNVVVRNSDISDNTDNSLIWINGTNLTFENNVIHDAGLRSGSGAHTECMYVWNVTGLTLKRNHFYHCSVMDVFVTGGAVANGGLVENNVFEKPWSTTGVVGNGFAFHFRNGGDPSPDPDNWDFRYNTFVGPLSISSESPVGAGGMRVIGNVFLSGAPCGKNNTTYSNNAFVSGACGTNAITNSLSTYQAGFASTADPGDYSLTSTSVLVNKGGSPYPATDRKGTARPSGGAPDIGAYELAG